MRHGQWHKLAHHVATAVLNTLVPPRCLLCRTPTDVAHHLCAECWSDLPRIDGPTCPASGLPLIGSAQAIRAYQSLPALTRQTPWRHLHAACFHAGSARKLVHRLKFHDDHGPVRFMARLIRQRIDTMLPPDAIIVPVPLHRRRLWQRRFNQSAELSRHIAALAGLPHMPDALLRTRPTVPQTALSGQQRRKNLRNAFRCNPRQASHLQERTVLLVDDVLTTGATARACATALRKAGVKHVHVAVFALASQQRSLHI